MKKVIVIGSGGHAKVVIDILQEMKSVEIFGITSNSLKSGETFCGYLILGNDDDLLNYEPKDYDIVIGVGGFVNNKLRKEIYYKIKEKGFSFFNAIHPKATISKTAMIGEAVVIFPGVIVNTDVQIGHNTIIITGSSIDHESVIEDHVLVSAGVTIGANTLIKEGTLVALGAKIISGITIGKNCLIAAGAVVVNDINDDLKVFGIPAKSKELDR